MYELYVVSLACYVYAQEMLLVCAFDVCSGVRERMRSVPFSLAA